MKAKDYLKQVSPNTNLGIREKLIKKGMLNIVCTLMEAYAEYRENILKPNELKGVSNNEQASEVSCYTCKYGIQEKCFTCNGFTNWDKIETD